MQQMTGSPMSPTPALRQSFRIFALLTYAALLINVGGFLRDVKYIGYVTPLFAAASCAFYSAIYLAPVVLIAAIAHRILLPRRVPDVAARRTPLRAAATCAIWILFTALLQLLLYVDRMIFHLYGFHLNGFVWNLIFTPGGIDSLGGGEATDRSTALIAAGFLLLQSVLLLLAIRLSGIDRPWTNLLSRRRLAWLSILVLVSGGFSQATFGISNLRGYAPVLSAANVFPMYMPITFNRLAQKLGVDVPREPALQAGVANMRLKYPRAPLRRQTPTRPPNIVWLTAESLRWDMLDQRIMPNTWRLAEQSTRFTRHYSGGNGTRMGMFAMFYGLYGSYWFPFLAERRGPVFFDQLLDMNYQMEMFTSAKFTYPEFDKTIFARIPNAHLHEYEAEPRWRRDEANVSKILEFIDGRDPARPFMTFMFFESPHAKYFFPEETAIQLPYARDINYAKLDDEVRENIGPIKNRYINACHYLDIQLGRIYAHLERRGLLDSTILIVTGDHGEEFMEKGRWGHNSTFSEEQTRPPLVIRVPGRTPAVVDRLTSHLDLPATLLPLLGVTNPPEDYSQGFDLFGPHRREFTVLADWDNLVYVDDRFKAVFPLDSYVVTRQTITDRDDRPLDDAAAFYKHNQPRIVHIMKQLNDFAQ